MDNLIIVPGLSSPFSKKQRPVYECLLEEVPHRLSTTKSEVLLLPGQCDSRGIFTGEYSIPAAVEVLKTRIQQCTEGEIMLLARSSGCDVVAAALQDSETRKKIARIVFWGPPPFWLYYDMFVLHPKPPSERMENDGLVPSSQIVATAVPFVSKLTEMDGSMLIATGALDEYSPPSYSPYMEWLCRKMCDTTKPKFRKVPDCPHGVTPACKGWEEYCDVIFSWLKGTLTSKLT